VGVLDGGNPSQHRTCGRSLRSAGTTGVSDKYTAGTEGP
jgi:hypothetical protein